MACATNVLEASDMGLWKELRIAIHYTDFSHPETQENVYLFVGVIKSHQIVP